jgi:DNA-binding transcriptional regulator PaaX
MTKKKEIAKYILLGISTVAVVGTVIVFPGIAPMFRWIVDLVDADHRAARKSLHSLERRGMVQVKQRRRTIRIVLTEKGKRQVKRYQLADLVIKKPKKWDGFWRVVMFDVPEPRKYSRDDIRLQLKRLGFVRIQKSVFVHPYPCMSVVKTLRDIYGLDEGNLYIFDAKVLEGEKVLRNYFHI